MLARFTDLGLGQRLRNLLAEPDALLLDDDLITILDSLAGVPAYEAITMGHPERMGIAYGWTEAEFLARSVTTTPGDESYRNLCIGCDRFHEQVLGPVLAQARERRRAAKGLAAGTAVPHRVAATARQER